MKMSAPVRKPARVLVVEDESSIRDSIVYALESEGFPVDWVASGSQALSKVEETHYALIVLDVGLPDMSGFDVCRELRRTHQVPVIFLTARDAEVDRVVGLEIGADDYVTKPFSPRELSARVRANIRRAHISTPESGSGSPAPGGSPFSVDPDRWIISYFSKPLTLSRYEFRLLSTLIARPGRVYSRAQLMELAWEEPDASMERTVDAHIKSVRAKLRVVRGGIEPIVTHRGIGYSLKEDW